MTITNFSLVETFWVNPKTRVIVKNTSPTLPDYAYKTGRWYSLYQSTVQSGLYRLYETTVSMRAQPNNPIPQTDPVGPVLWQQSYTSTPTVITAYADDVLRSSSWTTTHGDLSTRSINVSSRIYIDEDLYVSNDDSKFNLTNTLFFVNGVYHTAYQDTINKNAAWIRDGYRTFRQNRDYREVHAVDFTPLGNITQIPITSSMVTLYSGTDGQAYYITYPQGGLQSGTLAVAIEGTILYPPDGITILSDTVISLDPTKLDLIQKWYQAPMLRRTPPLVPDANVELSSDVHESGLDLFTTSTPVPKAEVTSQAFVLERLTSVHSALIILPQDTVLLPTPMYYETNQKDLLCINSNTAIPNSSLVFKNMIGSPTFLLGDSYPAKSYIWAPWMQKNATMPDDDPLYKIVLDPKYNHDNWFDIRPHMRLVQWTTLQSPILL